MKCSKNLARRGSILPRSIVLLAISERLVFVIVRSILKCCYLRVRAWRTRWRSHVLVVSCRRPRHPHPASIGRWALCVSNSRRSALSEQSLVFPAPKLSVGLAFKATKRLPALVSNCHRTKTATIVISCGRWRANTHSGKLPGCTHESQSTCLQLYEAASSRDKMLDASGEVCCILAFLKTSFDCVFLACRTIVYLSLSWRQIIDITHQRPAAHHLKAGSQPSTRPNSSPTLIR